MGLERLDRAQLGTLLPEMLLCGHLIDRAGMPHVLGRFGREGMRDIAVEEWQGASPHYTRRMQRALGYEGDDMVTIFKGLQLDVGAPPQFLDFRFTVESPTRGTFRLDHCGALLDVEPMGEDYVRTMCVDIEDPTMDATALATNPRARMRPIHRPPRRPADRAPHCEWVVDIDESREPVRWPEATLEMGRTEAALYAGVSRIDPEDEGEADYAGPLMSDVDFTRFSRSALVRIAEEVALQWHLLVVAGRRAVGVRAGAQEAAEIVRRQFTGVAGITAERLRAALGLGRDLDAVGAVWRLHPAFLPAGYTGVTVRQEERGPVLVLPRESPGLRDGAWTQLLTPDRLEPVEAMLHAVDPTWHARATVTADAVEVRPVRGPARPESEDVALVRFSKGAAFAFRPRRAIPLTVV